ncbi:HOP1 [Enterospora canceri]|uniref:HOP1 n=1 Tax=Enterospora canceri TaxID=1081671 RepID=A0A1Y1S7X7_9MICR|nr:HOP1 [Enterospora canceri]
MSCIIKQTKTKLVETFFSIGCYLSNLFGENEYTKTEVETSLIKNDLLNGDGAEEDVEQNNSTISTIKLVNTKESSLLFQVIRVIETRIKRIQLIQMGFFRIEEGGAENASLEFVMQLDLSRTCFNYTELCTALQEMNILGGLKSKIRVYSYELGINKYFLKCKEMWKIGDGRRVQSGAISVIDLKRGGGESRRVIPAENVVVPEKTTMINCTCTVNEDDGDMIECTRCFCWSHTVCAGFFSNMDPRVANIKYICLFCTGMHSYAERNKAFTRRIIDFLYNETYEANSVTRLAKTVSNRFGISERYAQKIVKDLRDLKLIDVGRVGTFRKDENGKMYKVQSVAVENEEAKKTIKTIYECKEVICHESGFIN